MSALESMLASNPNGEALMHPALAYELPAPNTAVVDRKQHCRAYPTSASSLSLTGTRTCRIRLGGDDGFIDPSSIRLQFTIDNKEPSKAIRPYCGPHGAWGQVRLMSGGTELDNISPSYGRFHTQFGFNHLTREEQFGSVGCEGMHSSKADLNDRPLIGEINGGGSLTVMRRLHLSLWSAGKLLPIKVCPQELELSLLTDVNDWLNAANNGSQAFEISNIQLLYDTLCIRS